MTYEPTAAGSMGANQRTVTAFFDNREDAQEAIDALRTQGIASSDIQIIEGGGAEGMTGERSERPYEEEGFWASLANLFMPPEDRYGYAEGLRRGGYLVTVQVSDAVQYEAVADILDDEGTIDIDERSREWQSDGWQPASAGSSSVGASMSASEGESARGAARDRSDTGITRGRLSEREASAAAATASDEVIPIAREELKVGKRAVDAGRVRIRSYVVEEPVDEDVELREEHVHVERRPVDRTVTGGDDLFRERAMELQERGEEAVVSKEARVVEEVSLGKEETFRTEKIHDTVRRTEVKVEDERADTEARTTNTSTGKDVRRSS